MEVGSPNFRIMDILPPSTLQAIRPLLPPTPVGAVPDPDPIQSTSAEGANTVREKTVNKETPVFVVPTCTAGRNPNPMPHQSIRGKNIFEEPSTSKDPILNPENSSSQNSRNLTESGNDLNIRKVPSGIKPPTSKDSLPPKKSDPVEPDAVPSKTYEAILTNKQKTGESGHHWWHCFRPGPH